jgi:hypothetical protein
MAHVWKIQKRESQGQRAAALQRRCQIMIFRADTKKHKDCFCPTHVKTKLLIFQPRLAGEPPALQNRYNGSMTEGFGAPQPLQTPGQPASKDKTLLYVLLAGGGCLLLFAVIAVIVFTVLFKVTAEPLDVVNKHLSALRSGDVEKAYSFCSKAFQQNTNLNDFQNFVNQNPLLTSSEFSSSNREISNGIAKLRGKIKGTNGATQEAEFQLVQEEKTWKIQYIDLKQAGVQSD